MGDEHWGLTSKLQRKQPQTANKSLKMAKWENEVKAIDTGVSNSHPKETVNTHLIERPVAKMYRAKPVTEVADAILLLILLM